jgi:hypothetical protein
LLAWFVILPAAMLVGFIVGWLAGADLSGDDTVCGYGWGIMFVIACGYALWAPLGKLLIGLYCLWALIIAGVRLRGAWVWWHTRDLRAAEAAAKTDPPPRPAPPSPARPVVPDEPLMGTRVPRSSRRPGWNERERAAQARINAEKDRNPELYSTKVRRR